jgi:3-phenylpropionate/trans-cinnamate dioxygenase ferredoxin reductase subunit
MADRILQRVASPQTSDFIRTAHRAEGVDIREGVGLGRLIGAGRVTSAKLTNGSELALDFVIVGVGITPASTLADACGVDIDNGIKTDAKGRTSDPNIWAAGDCASFPYKDTRIRLESVGNAIDQGELVAQNMLGADLDYVAKPWFWSDQFDIKLQIAGLNTGYDNVVERSSGTEGSVSFWYYQGPLLLAVDAVNDPRAYMVGKRLIEVGKSPDPAVISDPATDLKALLKG